MNHLYLTLSTVCMLHTSFALGAEISFLKFCVNESEPEPLPNDGLGSSGTFFMSVKKTSSPWYMPDLNCTLTLRTESKFHIFIAFSNVSLRNSSLDNLTVSFNNEYPDAVLAGQQVCTTENCEGLKFDSGRYSNMSFHFISANVTVPDNVTGFQAHYTVYDYVNSRTGACQGRHRFLCENKHCIWYDLVCDGHNNCGDMSDETKCIIPTKNTVWGILIIVIAVISMIILVPIFIFLATSGTRSIVKSVTVPNEPTPLLNPADCRESSGLLTSSEAISTCWPGTSYERRSSFTYGSAEDAGPSAVCVEAKKMRSVSVVCGREENQFL